MAHGALCVMTAGTSMMPMWSANSSITAELYLHLDKATLVQGVVQSITMKSSAMGPRNAWLTAFIWVLGFTIATIVKMQEWFVTQQVH